MFFIPLDRDIIIWGCKYTFSNKFRKRCSCLFIFLWKNSVWWRASRYLPFFSKKKKNIKASEPFDYLISGQMKVKPFKHLKWTSEYYNLLLLFPLDICPASFFKWNSKQLAIMVEYMILQTCKFLKKTQCNFYGQEKSSPEGKNCVTL